MVSLVTTIHMTTAQKRQKTSMQGYRLEQCSVTYFYTSVPNSTHHVLQQLFKMHCLTLNSFSLYLCVWCVHAEGEREGRSRRTSTEQKLTSPVSRLPCAHASRGCGSRLKAGEGGVRARAQRMQQRVACEQAAHIPSLVFIVSL